MRTNARRYWLLLGLAHAAWAAIAAADDAAEPPVAAPSDAPAVEPPDDVVVVGRSEVARLRQSSAAVKVIDTALAQRQTADMGEVLARTEGIGVRREGGLGSSTRFSLNGLSDDQIRFFLDGAPLEYAGYPFGVANVPVNLIDRVEIYRGVVPIHFGADALGGAVALVSDDNLDGTHAAASYQAGSFDTHRATFVARHLAEESGLFTRASAFFDASRNDYRMDDVPLDQGGGGEAPGRAYRFHDGYRAAGARLEFGFVERPWARRLLIQAFATRFDKDLQHDLVMSRPYGEVTYGDISAGATLRYEQTLAPGLELHAIAGYSHVRSRSVISRPASTCGTEAAPGSGSNRAKSETGLTTRWSGNTRRSHASMRAGNCTHDIG